jgi:hypothetical protein
MVIPLLLGFVYCWQAWRKPAAIFLVAWMALMLLPTILAADAPHFLRAAGILPAVLFFPAIGLDRIWQWAKIPKLARMLLVCGLIFGSLMLTARDYRAYGDDPEVGYYFESAAVDLAQQLNDEEPGTTRFLDERFWSNWPSLSFLVTDDNDVGRYLTPDNLPDRTETPTAIYTWPYESLDFIPEILTDPALILIGEGSLARGDLDDLPYPLFVRYASATFPADLGSPLAQFSDQLSLSRADVEILDENQLQIDLYWQADEPVDENLTVFIHVNGVDGLIGQDDNPVSGGRWPNAWWRPGLLIRDRHIVHLNEDYDQTQHQIWVGLYAAGSGRRLPVVDGDSGLVIGDSYQIGAK